MARSRSVEVKYIAKVESELKVLQKEMAAVRKEVKASAKEQKAASRTTSKYGGRMNELTRIAKYTAAAIAGLHVIRQAAGWMWEAIESASALNEAINKTNVVFGDAADSVMGFADTASDSIGNSEREALAAAATFGNLLTSFGLTEDAAASMSVQLVSLSSDLASFNDTTQDEALQALESALTGQIKPMRRFGSDLNAVRVQQEAVNMGLADASDTYIPQAIAAQARFSLILQDTANAQGDYIRTAEEMANSQRTMTAEWEDFKTQIGSAAVPTATSYINEFSDSLAQLNSVEVRMSQKQKELIEQTPRWTFALMSMGRSELPKLINALSGANDELEAMDYNTDALGSSALDSANGVVELADSAREAIDALGGYQDAILELMDANIAHEKALIRQEEAEENYQSVLAEHGPASDEANEADLRRREAALNVIATERAATEQTLMWNDALMGHPLPDKTAGESWEEYYRRIGEAAQTAASRIERFNAGVEASPGSTSAYGPDAAAGVRTPRHSGGDVPATGLYPLMAGEHVFTQSQMQSINNSQSISVTVNAGDGASGAVIATAVRSELESILNSSAVRAAS